MAAFVISSRRSLSIFLWWIETWAKVCWNRNQCKAHCTLSLEESNHQMIKKLTQHLKHPLRPKEHASTRRHERIVENSRIGRTCNTPWGSEQIISKQKAWKHISWGQWGTCFDQHSRKWDFFLTQHINPFAPEPPVTARADPGPFYPLWHHQF